MNIKPIPNTNTSHHSTTVIPSFLLVFLNISGILGETTLQQPRNTLDEMTRGDGLGDTHAAIPSRMKTQQERRSKLRMRVLMWVSHIKRSSYVDELCRALGVVIESTDLNIRNIPAIETLQACSLGRVMVQKSPSTVRFVVFPLFTMLYKSIVPTIPICSLCLTIIFRGLSDPSTFLSSGALRLPFARPHQPCCSLNTLLVTRVHMLDGKPKN